MEEQEVVSASQATVGGLVELQNVANQLPASIEALLASHSNALQISTYCKKAFEAEPEKVYGETRQYTHHALLNAAYHVHEVALQITNFVQLQTNELEKLDLQIRSMTTVLIYPFLSLPVCSQYKTSD